MWWPPAGTWQNHGKILAHQAGIQLVSGLTLESSSRQIAIRMNPRITPIRHDIRNDRITCEASPVTTM